MTIKDTELGIEIYADKGRAICPKANHNPIVESVLLSPSDSPDNWIDCDFPDEE